MRFRASQLYLGGINFFSNEQALHGGRNPASPHVTGKGSVQNPSGPRGGGEGSGRAARPCPQFESVVVLRDPVERSRSHVMEVDRMYSRRERDHRGGGSTVPEPLLLWARGTSLTCPQVPEDGAVIPSTPPPPPRAGSSSAAATSMHAPATSASGESGPPPSWITT